MKVLKQFEMHKPDGNAEDIATLYKWLGNVDLSSIRNKFNIDVTIIETRRED